MHVEIFPFFEAHDDGQNLHREQKEDESEYKTQSKPLVRLFRANRPKILDEVSTTTNYKTEKAPLEQSFFTQFIVVDVTDPNQRNEQKNNQDETKDNHHQKKSLHSPLLPVKNSNTLLKKALPITNYE